MTSLVVGLLTGFLLLGVVAGWLAGRLKRGGPGPPLANIAVGIAGAFAGGFLFGLAPSTSRKG